MLVKSLGDQWICSCGNWVDQAFHWCPDCCEERLALVEIDGRQTE